MEKTFYIKYYDSSTNTTGSGIGVIYPGYIDGLLRAILNKELQNVELRIGDFVFDVKHLRTLLK